MEGGRRSLEAGARFKTDRLWEMARSRVGATATCEPEAEVGSESFVFREERDRLNAAVNLLNAVGGCGEPAADAGGEGGRSRLGREEKLLSE